jgi:aspartyl-tRNA(Asn)/glutamyl-tRNA(Gln) amidotransferase subunit A
MRRRVERLKKATLAEVVEANERRFALALALNRFHQKYDLLATPVQSKPTLHVGTAPEAPYTLAFNLTHQPAASVPAGFDGNGLPVGLQIVAPLYAGALALRVARAFEQARPFVLPQLAALRRERQFG